MSTDLSDKKLEVSVFNGQLVIAIGVNKLVELLRLDNSYQCINHTEFAKEVMHGMCERTVEETGSALDEFLELMACCTVVTGSPHIQLKNKKQL